MRRRDLLIGGALGALAAAAAAPGAAYAMNYDPSYKTAHLYEYGDPIPWTAFTPRLNHVMQDFVRLSDGTYLVAQAETAADGSENTVISRLTLNGTLIDYMRLVGAGHGLGLEGEYRSGKVWPYLTWRGATADSAWRSNDYVRLSWYATTASTASGWLRGTCNQQFGLQALPVNDPEMLVKIDWHNRYAVCKHYDSAGNDVFTRRHLDDMLGGVDNPLERITLPISDGTLQGFATINDTLYRYLGAGARGGVMSSTDPIQIQTFDWNTGQPIAFRSYPTLGQDAGAWRDGYAEPEGMSVYRESDGHASLLIGLVTGTTNRRWQAFKFTDIGL